MNLHSRTFAYIAAWKSVFPLQGHDNEPGLLPRPVLQGNAEGPTFEEVSNVV